MLQRTLAISIGVLCLLLATQPGWSQETRATVSGRITDSTGAVVPGATIRLTHMATNVTRTTQSNESGIYSAPLLEIGTYQVTAEKQGFRRFGRELDLRTGDELELNMLLEVGAISESITITAETPLLETASSSVGQVVDSKRVADLPITMGLTYMLVRLAPGATYTGSFWADQPWEPEANVNYTMAGSSQGTAEITLDGSPTGTSRNSGGGTIPAGSPPSDMVAEFKVETVSFDGTTGQTQGGAIAISLKSGTNALHGTALYSNQPQNWTANQFFSNMNNIPRQPATINRWGGTANGPVWFPKLYNGKDRTFFTFAYEGIHYKSTRGTNFTVPSAAQRAGDFSQLLAIGGQYQIYNPFTTRSIGGGRYQRDPIPGNKLDPSKISPIAAKLLNTRDYPPPATAGDTVDGSNNLPLPGAAQTVFHSTRWFRFDHNLSNKQRAFFRFQQSRTLWNDPPFFGPESMYRNTHFQMHNSNYAFDHVYTLSPTMVMNIRASEARNRRASWANLGDLGVDLTKTYGFPQYFNDATPANIRHTPMINLSSFSTFGGYSYTNSQYPHETRALAVAFDRMQGAHALKFGFEYRQYIVNRYQWGGGAEGGSFTFNTNYTRGPYDNSTSAPRGQDLAAFLLGVPSDGNFQYVDHFAALSGEYYTYFQDNWKLTRKLTLNLSVRWELVGPMTERYNRSIGSFDPGATHSGNFDALTAAAYSLNPLKEKPASAWSTKGGVRFPGVGGEPRELTNRDWNNIMPRVGFAYTATRDTVVRGGYGTYYGPLGQRRRDVDLSAHTRTTNLVPTLDNGVTFIASLADPYPNRFLPIIGSGLGADTLLGQSIGTPFNRDEAAARTQKWQVDIQRQLPSRFVVSLGYIGSYTDQGRTSRNMRFFPSQYNSDSPLRDQPVINYWTATVSNPFAGLLPGTSYNSSSVQRQALVRNFPQFTGFSRHTNEGKSLYHALNVRGERRFSQGFTVMGSYTWSKQMDQTDFLKDDDPLPEKVISSADRPHTLSVSYIYELPFGYRKKWLATNSAASAVAGGWQVSAIWTVNSGPPYGVGDAIYYGGDLRDIVLPANQRTWRRWFKIDDFEKATAKQLSYHNRVLASRFTFLRQARLNYWDMSVIKNTRISEKFSAQFRAEALNALNQVRLSSPNTTASSSSFGICSSEASVPRRVQMTLKLIF